VRRIKLIRGQRLYWPVSGPPGSRSAGREGAGQHAGREPVRGPGGSRSACREGAGQRPGREPVSVPGGSRSACRVGAGPRAGREPVSGPGGSRSACREGAGQRARWEPVRVPGGSRSAGRVGAGQLVVRHRQADVVVVSGGRDVVGPADGRHVVLRQGVLREVVVADESSVSGGQTHGSVGIHLHFQALFFWSRILS